MLTVLLYGWAIAIAQVKWKDLLTDLNLVPSSLNVERLEEDSGLQRLIKAASPNNEVGRSADGKQRQAQASEQQRCG